MAPSEAALARAYMAKLDPDARREMKRIRAAIKAVAPNAVEGFSYRMPMFRLDGRVLVWYAAFRDHTSLFPIGDRIKRSLGKALEGHKTAKGTVQFSRSRPVPITLVKRLVKARVAEVRARRRAGQ